MERAMQWPLAKKTRARKEIHLEEVSGVRRRKQKEMIATATSGVGVLACFSIQIGSVAKQRHPHR
jgi:hypothetical protein